MPSAVAGVITVFLVYLTVRKLTGVRAAFAASLLLSLSIAQIEYSQEARAYALVSMFISLSFLGLILLSDRWRESTESFGFAPFMRSGGALYFFGTLGALYSHNTAVFFWLGVQLFFIAWWIKPFRYDRVCLGSWFAVNFVILLLWFPWFVLSQLVMKMGTFQWLAQEPWQQALSTWVYVHGTAIPILSLLGLYMLRPNRAAIVIMLSLIVFSSWVIWAYGFIDRPVFMRRTIIWGSLFTLMLAGIALGQLPRVIGNLVLLGLVLNGFVDLRAYNLANKAEAEDWRSAVEVFSQLQKPEDILFFRSRYVSRPFLYYTLPRIGEQESNWRVWGLHCGRGGTSYGKIEHSGASATVVWSKNMPNWKNSTADISKSTLWIVESHCPLSSTWRLKSDEWLAQFWRLQETYEFRGVTMYRWELRA